MHSRRRTLFAAILLIATSLLDAPGALAQLQPATAVVIPDSPAGWALKAWLDAFNSGDPAQLATYYKKYEPEKSPENVLGFRRKTGGFDLLSIQKAETLRIEFMVREKNSRTIARGKLEVGAVEHPTVTNFVLRAVPDGATVDDVTLNKATRAKVIDGAIAQLNENYVFPKVATQMEAAIRAHQKRGDYDRVTDGDRFAEALTSDLQAVSHDGHLRVTFSPVALLVEEPGPNPAQRARFRKDMEMTNCGFERVEVLAQNVGYLKFNFFADPEVCGPTATAAMNFLGNVDALIIDLRENGGGEPSMVALISTYLFSEPTHLNDLWERKGNTTEQYWTLPYVPGKRMADVPVFVLTSKRTFSGGEEFCYNLKNLKRATIVGETTGGGAHPVAPHRIDEHFGIGVPFARAINPISKTNWEGVGVEPDIKVPAADALSTAQKLASEKLSSK
jgi:retinol-binding protein 3